MDIHQGHWYSPTDQKLPNDDRFLYVKRLEESRPKQKTVAHHLEYIYRCDIPTIYYYHIVMMEMSP